MRTLRERCVHRNDPL
jgi:hypothetical protein